MSKLSKRLPDDYAALLAEVKERIRSAQYDALKVVNKEMIALYWDLGKLIVERQNREGWGKSVVERLASDLQNEFPGVSGFSVQNLWYMRQFYLEYHDNEKLQPLVGEISWSKNLIIFQRCKDHLERELEHLNAEVASLAATIKKNFEELGVWRVIEWLRLFLGF